MWFIISLAFLLGLVIVPGLINYYVNRYFTPPGVSTAPTAELITASLTMTFAFVVLDIAGVVLISLVWDDLKEQISDFVQLGVIDFAKDRPIATTGVLSVVSIAYMTVLGLLGALRVPSRWIR
jgi:hypothetical protein